MNMDGNRRTTQALEIAGTITTQMGAAMPMDLRPQDALLLDSADRFDFNGRPAWTVGEGPLVVLVHGYGGRGSQMAPMAHHLAAKGFRAVFFDAGGHGEAPAERISFHTFMVDTRDLLVALDEPVHGLIGHSAGGLGMMRARRLYGVKAARYGVIAAPLFPYPPLNAMRANGVPEDALDHIKVLLCSQFQTHWSKLTEGEAYAPEDGASMLAIYDEDDDRVLVTDGNAIAERWPGTTVVVTRGQGHNRVLKADETLAAVTEFLRG